MGHLPLLRNPCCGLFVLVSLFALRRVLLAQAFILAQPNYRLTTAYKPSCVSGMDARDLVMQVLCMHPA